MRRVDAVRIVALVADALAASESPSMLRLPRRSMGESRPSSISQGSVATLMRASGPRPTSVVSSAPVGSRCQRTLDSAVRLLAGHRLEHRAALDAGSVISGNARPAVEAPAALRFSRNETEHSRLVSPSAVALADCVPLPPRDALDGNDRQHPKSLARRDDPSRFRHAQEGSTMLYTVQGGPISSQLGTVLGTIGGTVAGWLLR